jgi:outer membrane protein assembly factor BamB
MYRHDPQHTGYSTSITPDTNQTFWTEQFGDWVRSSPCVHNNTVFIASDDNNIYALDTSTGNEIWNYTTTEDVDSSPAVAYGRVYIGGRNRKFYCLDETNGNLLWSFDTVGAISSSACIMNSRVVFGTDDYKVYCLDAIAGNPLWNFSTGGAVRSSPAVADGKVFFGSIDRKVYALNLTSGALIWSYATPSSIADSPSVVAGRVFISVYKTICCLGALNGGLVWNYTAGDVIHSSPAIVGGNVYFGCNDYRMYCLSGDGALKWTFTAGDIIYSSPAVAGGRLLFGSDDRRVYCLNATDGAFVWCYDTGGSIKTSSPAVANGVVFIAASYYPPFSGKLFAFGPANTPPVAANLTIAPSLPRTTDNLTAGYDYYDEDSDPQNGTEIRWGKDGVLQPAYNDTLVVPFTATAKGQKWCFTVHPKDGKDFGELHKSFEVTIQNSPPTINSVSIIPKPAYANDTLIANAVGWFDVDSDLGGYFYQWQKYKAGSWQNITGATNQTLSHDNFAKGDLVKIACIPYDGESCGDKKEDTIAISNSPPEIISYYPLINPTISEGETQEFNITKYDIDLEPLTVEWYSNGTKLPEASDVYIYTTDFESAGTYNVTVAASDGIDQAKKEWLLTVTDVKRDLAVTDITLSKEVVGQGYPLEINVTVENQGDLSEIFYITINANTTMIHTKEITLASGTSASLTFTWNTTGFDKGNYTISVYVYPVPGETNMTNNIMYAGPNVRVTIPGDVDGDFDVDILDVVKITSIYATKLGDLTFNPNSDINNDGVITILDVVICTSHYAQIDP